MEAPARKTRTRTCIACGAQSDKMDLYRIVRNADGTISFDAKGRAPGRGAYICSAKCLVAAFEKHKVQRALRCAISAEEQEGVIAEAMAAFGEEG